MKGIQEKLRQKFLTHILTGTREQLVELSTLLFDVAWKSPAMQEQLIDSLQIGQISAPKRTYTGKRRGRPPKKKVAENPIKTQKPVTTDEELKDAIIDDIGETESNRQGLEDSAAQPQSDVDNDSDNARRDSTTPSTD